MGSPRCWAVVGEAVTVIVADGWNRFTVFMTLAVIGVSLKSASSLKENSVVSLVGSGSPGWTVRTTEMVSVWLGARVPSASRPLTVILLTGPTGFWTMPLRMRLPSKVSVTFWG